MPDAEIGVLLPHFGDDATVDRIVGHAPALERLGFQSAWVRDNLAYVPHEFEPAGRTFVDGFVALAAVAAVTKTMGVGTAVTIPTRPPAITVQLVGSLCWLAPGRVQLGMGFGSPRPAYEAVGIPFADRFELCEQTLAAVRGAATDADSGDAGPRVDPAPPPDIPIWFGGAGDRSLRCALRWCDGLLLARADHLSIASTRDRAAELAEDTSRPLRMGTVVLVLPGRTYEAALADVDQRRLLDELGKVNKRHYDDVRDARGAVLVGSPDDIAEGVRDLTEAGVELIVVDLRLTAPRFEEWTTALGEVLFTNR